MVIAISPISYAETFRSNIFKENILILDLYDTAENIFFIAKPPNESKNERKKTRGMAMPNKPIPFG